MVFVLAEAVVEVVLITMVITDLLVVRAVPV